MASLLRTLTYTTGSIAPGASTSRNDTIVGNIVDIVKIKVTPSNVNPSELTLFQIFQHNTFLAADLVYNTVNFTGNLVDPIETDGVTSTERNQGFVCKYEDGDSATQIHNKITNNGTVSNTYTVSITYSAIDAMLIAETKLNTSINSATWMLDIVDNSPPNGPAGVANSTFVPDGMRIRLNTGTSGQSVGANGALLLEQGSTGVTYTTITSNITGGLGVQSVQVANSAVFIDPAVYPVVAALFSATIDPGMSNGEAVTVVSIVDPTHITANFLNNHTSGAVIGLRYKGAQCALSAFSNDVLTDGSGTPGNNDIFAANFGVQAKNNTFHELDALEVDVINNSGTDAAYVGSGNKPVLYGMTVVSTGTNHCTYGVDVTSGASGQRFLTGFEAGGIRDNAFTVVNNGAGNVTNGLNIAAASAAGILIGPHQTAPSNPAFPLTAPTHGIQLTARGTSGTHDSLDYAYEELISGVSSLWTMNASGGNTEWSVNGTYLGTAITNDGGTTSHITTPQLIVNAKADDTNPGLYLANHAQNTVEFQVTNVGTFGSNGRLVSALPSAATCNGQITRVTDANSPTIGSNVTGGGGANALVWSNGSHWTVIGV